MTVIELGKEIAKMSNYTKPHIEDYEDTPEDYFYSAMTFSQALGAILENGQGILIDLKGDMKKMHPEVKRVIVVSDDNLVKIIDATTDERVDDLKHGDMVMMIEKENIRN